MPRSETPGVRQRPEWGRVAASGFVAWLVRANGALAPGAERTKAAGPRPFRLAFSSSMFTEVNASDARAAMKVWSMTVAQERGIPVESDPQIYASAEEVCATSKVAESKQEGPPPPAQP